MVVFLQSESSGFGGLLGSRLKPEREKALLSLCLGTTTFSCRYQPATASRYALDCCLVCFDVLRGVEKKYTPGSVSRSVVVCAVMAGQVEVRATRMHAQ